MNRKVVVSVDAQFDSFGHLTPLSFYWQGGRKYEIHRVLDCRRAVSTKAGGSGIRYTCKVGTKIIYLFMDDNIWYLESI